MEDERELPDVVLPPSSPYRDVPEPIGLSITIPRGSSDPLICSEEGEIPRGTLFAWLLGKTVYVSVSHRGIFDTIFKGLPEKVLHNLAVTGEAYYDGYNLVCFGQDGTFSVRRGNVWGSLSNISKLSPEAVTPKSARLAVELATSRMARYGFSGLDFKSVGRVAQDLIMRHCRFQPRAPQEHTWMHLQAFKGARMEGVIFGTSNVYDYDIKSAFPSFVAELIGTRGMEWVVSTEVIAEARYAAVLCDIQVNERLIRGPIGVRYGERSLYFPVGYIPGVWISKPEVDLLTNNPYLGRIVKIHSGSWGVGGPGIKPFRRLLRSLYALRSKDEFLEGYLKLVMAALWGKFISTYVVVKDLGSGEGWTQASSTYNPVFGSHVTAAMRCDLYLRSVGFSVVGEFVDGLSTTKPVPDVSPNGRFGELIEKGQGVMTLFSDSVKASSWKNTEILELARGQRDQSHLELPMEYYHTIRSAHHMFGPSRINDYLGRRFSTTQSVRLGSSMRFMGNDPLRVGDFIDGIKQSYPPRAGEMRFFRFMRGV